VPRAAAPARKSASRRPPKPGEAKASRGDLAYQRLFEAIERGTLKPGSRLRELELSTWLGASRTPIREALGRLEGEGLIGRDPSRGMIAAGLRMVAEFTACARCWRAPPPSPPATRRKRRRRAREIAQRDRDWALSARSRETAGSRGALPQAVNRFLCAP
jgi:DNA-binding transcriptional MocR family regulator